MRARGSEDHRRESMVPDSVQTDRCPIALVRFRTAMAQARADGRSFTSGWWRALNGLDAVERATWERTLRETRSAWQAAWNRERPRCPGLEDARMLVNDTATEDRIGQQDTRALLIA